MKIQLEDKEMKILKELARDHAKALREELELEFFEYQ